MSSRKPRAIFGLAALALCAALVACGGGGGGGGSTIPNPGGGATPTPTPVPTIAPTTSSTSGPLSTSGTTVFSFGSVSNGTATTVTSATMTMPQVGIATTATASMQSTLPTGASVPQAQHVQTRTRASLCGGCALTTLAYITLSVNPSTTITASPAFTIVIPSNVVVTSGNAYVVVDVNGVWQEVSGPVTAANSMSFPSGAITPSPLTLTANTPYFFAIVTTGTATTPTPTPVITPTASPTASPTTSPTVSPASGTVSGNVQDLTSGSPVIGATVVVVPNNGNIQYYNSATPPSAGTNVIVGTTDSSGNFSLSYTTQLTYQTANYGCNVVLFVYGNGNYAPMVYHGKLSANAVLGAGATGCSGNAFNVGTLHLMQPTADEKAALTAINAFRAAPGPIGGPTYPQYSTFNIYGHPNSLVMDENLAETGQYWAGEMHQTDTGGHTCATIGNPPGCIEYAVYEASLPGESGFGPSGQNIAGNFLGFEGSSTLYADEAWEAEGGTSACTTLWKSDTCAAGDPPTGAGHFQNIMDTSYFVGFGAVTTTVPYFVMQTI